jgi:zinc protease
LTFKPPGTGRMKKITLFALFILLSLAVSGSSFAQDRPLPSALSNGLGVISFSSSGGTAAACLFIKTGFDSEPAGKSGITALLCSSVLSSNPAGNPHPLSLMIERDGGKVTADVEAGYTCFSLVSPGLTFADDLKALASMVSDGHFSDTAVQVEKAALIAREGLYQDRAEEKMFHALFPPAPPEDMEKLSRADLLAWRTERFRPDGSLLSICGSFSTKDAVRLAAYAFNGWKAGSRTHGPVESTRVFKPHELVELESRPGTAGVLFACKFPSPGSPDYCAALAARAILSGGTRSCVYKCLRADKPRAYSLGSSLRWESACPVMTVYSVTDETRIDGAIKGIKSSVKAIEEGKFSREELERGKEFALGDAELLAEGVEGTARYAGLYALSGARRDYRESLPKQFSRVSKEDVVKAAEKYLNGNALVIMRPQRER